MCSIILPWAKWLTFCGMSLATLAALLLAVTGTDLYNWVRRSEARNLFSGLGKLATKHETLEAATQVPSLLYDSEIVHARLKAKRKGGLIGLAPWRHIWLILHDQLRKELNLHHQSLEWPTSIVRSTLVEISRQEVWEALEHSIATTTLSESRYFKFAIWTFVTGSALQLLAGLPWC